jgi:hypothetical protein
MCCSRRLTLSLPLVLLALVLLPGCREPETLYELGPRFATEAPIPGHAQIYVYWPPAIPALRGWYHLAAPVSPAQLLPSGYLSLSAVPGRIPFQVERCWSLGAATSVSWPSPERTVTAEAGRMYYLRVVALRVPADQLALQLMDATTGQGEIRSCRLVRWRPALYGGR